MPNSTQGYLLCLWRLPMQEDLTKQCGAWDLGRRAEIWLNPNGLKALGLRAQVLDL